MPTKLKTTVPDCLGRGRILKVPWRPIAKDSQVIRGRSARGILLAFAAFGSCLINLQGLTQVIAGSNGGKDFAGKVDIQPADIKTEPVDGFFDHPQLGAEVWAIPGTTAAQYDNWMKTLAQFHMHARLYMSPEKHMYPSMSLDGPEWKAHLEEYLQPFDLAFAAANRHDVKIMLTLPTFWAPQDADGWSRQEQAIRLIVRRYKNNQALYLWGISSEPHIKFTGSPNVGAGGTGDPTDVSKTPFDLVAPGYHAWLANKYGNIKSLNVKWRTEFAGFDDVPPNSGVAANGFVTQQASYNDWHEYWRFYLTDFMMRISKLVRQDDPSHPLTVNPDNIMSNLSAQSQDISAWRPAVSVMGASLHPAWHFSRLRRRDQYALGVAFTCDELRGLSAPKPFMVTEMQGGPVIYSGGIQISPNQSDIAQWTWTAIGSGARQLYYWMLNTRPEGVEAGEWALLDYQDKPTTRLIAAGSVEKVLDDKAEFFRHSHPIASPVTILLSMDAMTFQLSQGSQPQSPNTAASMDEALGIYQAFLSLGVPVNIRSIDDFPWSETVKGQVVLLPHLSALTREQAAHITTFETNGNMVIATGLTGMWNPMYELQTLRDFPLEKALGGDFKSAALEDVDNSIPITVNQSRIILPAKQIVGEIDNRTGKVLSEQDGRVLATETHLGKGSAYWIPSLVGTAAFMGDQKPLAELISLLTANVTKDVAFKFASYQPDVVLRTLQNQASYLTVITNGSNSPVKCQLAFPAGLKSTLLWGEMGSIDDRGEVSLGARQTLVLMWQ